MASTDKKVLASRKKEVRDVLYRDIIKAVMSVLKKYDIKDIRWALNRWAKTEATKAKLRKQISDAAAELKGIK